MQSATAVAIEGERTPPLLHEKAMVAQPSRLQDLSLLIFQNDEDAVAIGTRLKNGRNSFKAAGLCLDPAQYRKLIVVTGVDFELFDIHPERVYIAAKSSRTGM